MVETKDSSQDSLAGSPPTEFVDTVRLLLEHLYDLPFIQQHPLATHPSLRRWATGETPSQSLRAVLLEAIDAFKVSVENVQKPPNRYYNLVYLHYVDGMTIQEAAHQLGVSLRQAYRDLQRGVETVAGLLWEQRFSPEARAVVHEELPSMSVYSELARLVPRMVKTELGALLAYAEQAVQRLAEQKGTALVVDIPIHPIGLNTDVGIAQQALVRVLSQAVKGAESQAVQVRGRQESRTVRVEISPYPLPAEKGIAISDTLSIQLLSRLGWSVEPHAGHGGNTLCVCIPTDLRVLLVIDDNEGIAELLERYLTDMPFRVMATTSASEGLGLAHDLMPDLIMLDIMMPEIDGWELLQRLHNSPETAHIPVVVCSVFNDPELAYSLGATAFLPKPLSREVFLETLLRLHYGD